MLATVIRRAATPALRIGKWRDSEMPRVGFAEDTKTLVDYYW